MALQAQFSQLVIMLTKVVPPQNIQIVITQPGDGLSHEQIHLPETMNIIPQMRQDITDILELQLEIRPRAITHTTLDPGISLY